MLRFLNRPFMVQWYLITRLPAAWFMGVRVKQITPEKAEIYLPYGWRSQNPFRSIYFAAQCAAGEFSTGTLCLLAINGRRGVSMLVTKVTASFYKKVNTRCIFSCEQGLDVLAAVNKTLETGQPVELDMLSTGRNDKGEIVSEVRISWSFLAKNT